VFQAKHPLRVIRRIVNDVLAMLDGEVRRDLRRQRAAVADSTRAVAKNGFDTDQTGHHEKSQPVSNGRSPVGANFSGLLERHALEPGGRSFDDPEPLIFLS
jgi:hypothetical protein